MVEYDMFTLISNMGFPIAMVLWFMIRTEKVINKVTEAVNNLAEIVKISHK